MTIWTTHPDTTSLATAYAGYFLCFLSLGTAPLLFAWLADMYVFIPSIFFLLLVDRVADEYPSHSLPQDAEARTLIVGFSVAAYYGVSAWSQVLVWPASQAPYCESIFPRLPSGEAE